jgi:membrane-bound serine protease (ClpP class)
MIAAILLTLAGFVLMVAEVLFPSLGTFGLLAAAAIVGADVLAARDAGAVAMWVLIGVQAVGIPVVLKSAFWLLPRLPFTRGMILTPPAPATHDAVERLEHLLGATGVTVTDLRPSGTAVFGEERKTVVAEEGTLDRGTRVRVVAVEAYRIVVRPEA